MDSIKKTVERIGKKRFTIYIAIFALLAANLIGAAVMLVGAKEPVKGERQYQALAAAAHNGSVSVDFNMLSEKNPDVRAWLISEGTGIDYPVVQGEDNSFYRTHLFSGKSNRLGCLYIDSRCADDFSDRNTVIYGGKQFDSLYKYHEQSYYELIPYLTVVTPEGNKTVSLYAGVRTENIDEAVKTEFATAKEFTDYLSWLDSNSTFSSNITVSEHDSIVTFCANNGEEGYILVGKTA